MHDFQVVSVKALIKKPNHALFLPTGLGKTRVILTMFEQLMGKKRAGSMLVVGTLRVIYNVWPKEIAKWKFDHTYTILHGKGKKSLDTDFDIYLINYEGLPWFYQQITENPELCPEILILDESTKIKRSSSTRFKLLKNMRKVGMFDRIIPMSGTPNPNGYMNLWTQMFMIDGGKALGQYITHYRKEFFHRVKAESYSFYVLLKGAEEKIQKKVKPLITHIPRSVIKLPPLTERVVPVSMDKRSMTLYETMRKKLVITIRKKTITAANAGVVTGKCRQIANGIVFTGEGRNIELIHEFKLDALKDILEESSEPTMVGYEFVPDGDRIQKALKGYRLARIGGGIKGDKEIAQWDAGKLDVMLVQTASVAHGLNLQFGGHRLILYGLTWDLEVYQQLVERLWRQGQVNPVLVLHLLAVDTIDYAMADVLEGKAKTQREFLRAVEHHAFQTDPRVR